LDRMRRNEWSQLLRHVDRTARRQPDRAWILGSRDALNSIRADTFAGELAEWLKLPEGQASLSTGGRHVLKTLIWFSAVAGSNRLDDLLPDLIDLQFVKPEAAVPLIYALGYWLESRPREFADEHRRRLREKWPLAGSRIRD